MHNEHYFFLKLKKKILPNISFGFILLQSKAVRKRLEHIVLVVICA